ncbi:U-box domain-containing protein 35-like [Musa acuminata AAA Group]|uniref:U-box domain-containing protein 35-like n=1 Tax=Musa acuminata AAA Group TaxID=214697 RepID=UPI0031D635AE
MRYHNCFSPTGDDTLGKGWVTFQVYSFSCSKSISKQNLQSSELRDLCRWSSGADAEVVLEDSDISKAIIDYINANYVHDIVVGASSRNALTKYLRFSEASAMQTLVLCSVCRIEREADNREDGDNSTYYRCSSSAVATEIATALLFLHQAKPEPLVHRDLKPANILLDRNYLRKMSNVGLARLVPPSVANQVSRYLMISTVGTFCYINPEYQQTGMLGTKSDIYSFGILLLQIITAKPPMGLTHPVERAIERGTIMEMLDATVKDWPVEETLGFAKLALKCAEPRRKDRPDLGMVVLPELNRLRNLGHAYESSSIGSDGTATSRSSYSSNGQHIYGEPDLSSIRFPRHHHYKCHA